MLRETARGDKPAWRTCARMEGRADGGRAERQRTARGRAEGQQTARGRAEGARRARGTKASSETQIFLAVVALSGTWNLEVANL